MAFDGCFLACAVLQKHLNIPDQAFMGSFGGGGAAAPAAAAVRFFWNVILFADLVAACGQARNISRLLGTLIDCLVD